ncbi:MAG: hypothetical protein ABII98_03025, partial [bacterium]
MKNIFFSIIFFIALTLPVGVFAATDVSYIKTLDPAGQSAPQDVPWACMCSFSYSFCAEGMICLQDQNTSFRNPTYYFTSEQTFLSWTQRMSQNTRVDRALKLVVDTSGADLTKRCDLIVSAQRIHSESGLETAWTEAAIANAVNSGINDFNLFHLQSDPVCKIFYPTVDRCCCQQIESDILVRKNQCQKISEPSGPNICSAVGSALNPAVALPVPANGDCKSLEVEKIDYNPTATTFDITTAS